ncbi:MAG TPA: hemerythrin family protein, partial [Candidatus Omnitrophota bacterium]|nr:hemerythrin family protein [Candidatus Omnitrophota bacterium]
MQPLQDGRKTPHKPLPWLESFGVGAKHIDDEHRDMIKGCNDLCAMALRGARWRDLRVMAAELIATIEQHFVSEEALFPLICFPETAQHLSEHENIRRRLGHLLDRQRADDTFLDRAIALRDMTIEHILRHDIGIKT